MIENSETKAQHWLRRLWSALNFRIPILEVYPILLIVFLALMLLPARPWLVEMLCNFLDLALLPSLPVLIVLLVMRRWRSAALWVVPTAAFLFLFGGLLLPKFGPHDNSGMHIKVMTWNLNGMIQSNRQTQVDMLRNSGADIIALQEVSSETAPGIDAQLSDVYPYRVLYPKDVAGTGLLSKFPIISQDVFQITSGAFNYTKAVLDLNGVPITVISAHPPPPMSIHAFRYGAIRYKEAGADVKMAQEGGPVLVMGDFYMTDLSTVYRIFTDAGLKDTFREAGWGFGVTWPTVIDLFSHRFPPIMRIDYIWHTGEFRAVSARVGSWAVSDHLPVIAELEMGE